MKISRIIIATIVVSVFNLIVGMLTCGSLFSWVYKLEPTNVWKPMEGFSFPIMIITTLFINLIFVFIYALINKGIPAQNKYFKGLIYGLIVWSVGLVPGMIATYLYMTVSQVVIIYWTIWGLIVSPLKGLITASIYVED